MFCLISLLRLRLFLSSNSHCLKGIVSNYCYNIFLFHSINFTNSIDFTNKNKSSTFVFVKWNGWIEWNWAARSIKKSKLFFNYAIVDYVFRPQLPKLIQLLSLHIHQLFIFLINSHFIPSIFSLSLIIFLSSFILSLYLHQSTNSTTLPLLLWLARWDWLAEPLTRKQNNSTQPKKIKTN